LASAIAGENGKVIGIDMTDEQLEVAIKYIDYHTKALGLSKPNVEFCKGVIEDLRSAGIEDNSMFVRSPVYRRLPQNDGSCRIPLLLYSVTKYNHSWKPSD
jgi:Methyltransferase domain